MNRWSTRLRRAASIVLGVHLLQVVLLAASAACDLVATGGPATTVASAMTRGAGAHEAAPVAAHHGSHDDSRNDSPHESHHESHTTNCPMAMACAATAVMAPVHRFAAVEVHVTSDRIAHQTRVLRSLHLAPEPPPPRG